MEDQKYRRVIYLDKEYEVVYIYESGYCEIREACGRNYLLVPLADLNIDVKSA